MRNLNLRAANSGGTGHETFTLTVTKQFSWRPTSTSLHSPIWQRQRHRTFSVDEAVPV